MRGTFGTKIYTLGLKIVLFLITVCMVSEGPAYQHFIDFWDGNSKNLKYHKYQGKNTNWVTALIKKK